MNKSEIKCCTLLIILSIVAFISSMTVISIRLNDDSNIQDGNKILDAIVIDNNDNKNIEVVPDSNSESKEEETIKKPELMLKIDALKQENSEVVGWIEIEDTKINYPVMQGVDNEFYLSHNYKKEKNIEGSIFVDKSYDFSKPSTNLLIYGHRYPGGTVFEDLKKYTDESFYKNHQTIKFTTSNEESEYEIIAVFLSRVYYKNETDVFRYYYFIDAANEEEFNYYINNSKESSLYDTGKTAVYGDALMTLSTCAHYTENGRLAIVAKKVSSVKYKD